MHPPHKSAPPALPTLRRREGNVGIGTASPGEALTVVPSASIGGINIRAQLPLIDFTDLNSTDNYRIAVENSTFYIQNLTDAGTPTRFMIDTAGNVGIGTTSPYAKLTAWGDTTGKIFEAVTSASTTALSISATGFATTTLSGLNIFGSATTTSNVGINLSGGCFAIGGTCVGSGAGADISITDNITNAFRVYEGTNDYFNIDTTNSSESLSFGTRQPP